MAQAAAPDRRRPARGRHARSTSHSSPPRRPDPLTRPVRGAPAAALRGPPRSRESHRPGWSRIDHLESGLNAGADDRTAERAARPCGSPRRRRRRRGSPARARPAPWADARRSPSRSTAAARCPGRVPLRVARVGRAGRADADVPLRRPRRRGRERDARRHRRAARARATASSSSATTSAARAAPGCCAARELERDPHLRDDRARRGVREPARRRPRTTTRRRTPSRTWRRSAPQLGVEKLTLFGISYGTELAHRLRARLSRTHVERLILDSVVDADDRDPFGPPASARWARRCASLCPAGCRGISDRPRAPTSAKLVAQLRAKPLHGVRLRRAGRARTRHDRRRSRSLDLMFDADYIPPLRAGVPAAVQAALAGDGALLAAARSREGEPLDDLGPPARLLDRPLRHRLRDDAAAVGPRHADRAAWRGRAQRIAALAAGRVRAVRRRDRGRPTRSTSACAGRTSRARRRPPPAALSDRPDADPPGRRGPAHAAGGLRPRRGAHPGLAARRRPRRRARASLSGPGGCGDPPPLSFLRGQDVAGRCKRVPTGVPPVSVPPLPSRR